MPELNSQDEESSEKYKAMGLSKPIHTDGANLMPKYRCNVCHVFEFDIDLGDPIHGIDPGTRPEDLPPDWKCHICGSDKTHMKLVEVRTEAQLQEMVTCPYCGKVHTLKMLLAEEELIEYLAHWRRTRDETEVHMGEIHHIATRNQNLIEPMRTKAPVPQWDDILILGAQLAKIPLNDYDHVKTGTTIGPAARKPMVLDMPAPDHAHVVRCPFPGMPGGTGPGKRGGGHGHRLGGGRDTGGDVRQRLSVHIRVRPEQVQCQ